MDFAYLVPLIALVLMLAVLVLAQFARNRAARPPHRQDDTPDPDRSGRTSDNGHS
jgi:hypothetical protein